MKKAILVLFVVLAIALAGCSGGGEKKEEKVSTPTPAPTQTSVPEETPTPEKIPESGETTPSGEAIRTLYEMFVNKKMLHGSYEITVEGKKQTGEFWFYYDASNNQKMVRMEGQMDQEKSVIIVIEKYEENTATTTMYMKGTSYNQMGGDCDWVSLTQTITVSPSEVEDIKNEPADQAVEATLVREGNIVEHYTVEYVDYDPSLFQPDGKVCSMVSFVGGSGG